MSRPYVIIHTHTALDGNINGMDLPEFEAATRYYQDIALTPGVQQLDIGVYVNGKNTAEDNITHYRTPKVDPDAVVPAGDFHAVNDPGMYYVSIDPRGELDWPISDFNYGGVRAHVLEVLSERRATATRTSCGAGASRTSSPAPTGSTTRCCSTSSGVWASSG